MASACDSARLGPSLKYLFWAHLAGCVLEVFRENQLRENEPGTRLKAFAAEIERAAGIA
jgi:hypothetical protein